MSAFGQESTPASSLQSLASKIKQTFLSTTLASLLALGSEQPNPTFSYTKEWDLGLGL